MTLPIINITHRVFFHVVRAETVLSGLVHEQGYTFRIGPLVTHDFKCWTTSSVLRQQLILDYSPEVSGGQSFSFSI